MADKIATIALLNDLARTTLTDCRLVITQGIAAIAHMEAVIEQVRSYTDFTPSNDPYGEHDFGSFEHQGQTLFWKFDLYDPGLVKIALTGSFC